MKRRRRPADTLRPLPSSTTALVFDDWLIIRHALQLAVLEHTASEQWPAAEAAQRVLTKIGPISVSDG